MPDTAILEAPLKLSLMESDSISPICSANYNFMFLGLWVYALKTVPIATAFSSHYLHDGKIHSSLFLPLSLLLPSSTNLLVIVTSPRED